MYKWLTVNQCYQWYTALEIYIPGLVNTCNKMFKLLYIVWTTWWTSIPHLLWTPLILLIHPRLYSYTRRIWQIHKRGLRGRGQDESWQTASTINPIHSSFSSAIEWIVIVVTYPRMNVGVRVVFICVFFPPMATHLWPERDHARISPPGCPSYHWCVQCFIPSFASQPELIVIYCA